ncbi:hypothetical protein FRB99_006821 [Tulasnella sp. 403]|nr:hypothetical protein FRB99_006821 [Tulasnella sp. 403]
MPLRVGSGETRSVTLDSNTPEHRSGRVYDTFRGRDKKGRIYALKRCRFTGQRADMQGREQFDKDVIERAAFWQDLHHDNLHPFLGTVEDCHGYLYFVTPWEEAGTLFEYMEQHPDMDRRKCLHEVASALLYLHDHGIIHGAVNAHNILIDPNRRALLSDFAIVPLLPPAAFAGCSPPSKDYSRSALRWEAPELQNSSRSEKSDVYAFGMTIYHVVTGRVPFYQYRLPDILYDHVIKGQELPCRDTKPWEDYADLWNIAEQCWRRNTDERPSMRQVKQLFQPPAPRRSTPSTLSSNVDTSDTGSQTSRASSDSDPTPSSITTHPPGSEECHVKNPPGSPRDSFYQHWAYSPVATTLGFICCIWPPRRDDQTNSDSLDAGGGVSHARRRLKRKSASLGVTTVAGAHSRT